MRRAARTAVSRPAIMLPERRARPSPEAPAAPLTFVDKNAQYVHVYS
jgi:hypothetical protein